MSTVVEVSAEGQISIPERIRERCGVKPGMKMKIIEHNGCITIKPLTYDPIEAACGYFNEKSSLTDLLLEERKRERG